MNNFSFRSYQDLNKRLRQLAAHHGGEGTVYDDHQHLAIKIFNEKEVNVARKERKVRRLNQQFRSSSYDDVVYPLEMVTVKGHFVGYTMKYIKNSSNLDRIAEKSFMGENDLRECLRLMSKLAQCVEKIHNNGMIIGDFHPGQVLVESGDIHFVDTDSWGWTGQGKELGPDLKCLPFYVDPFSRDFSCRDVVVKNYSKASDYYSLAVIAFEVLTGEHPFGGVYQIDQKMPKEMRARNGLSVLGNHDIKLMKGKTWETWMSDELKEAFLDIFERKKRYNIEKFITNQLMDLKYCRTHNGYYNGNYNNCPKCSRRAISLFPSITPTKTKDFSENLFLANSSVKKMYDYKTYLNTTGEVVRVNERAEEIRKSPKGIGSRETFFLDNEKYMVKTKPESWFKRLGKAKSADEAADVIIYKDEVEFYKFSVNNKKLLRICGNSLYYVESTGYGNDATNTLKCISIINGAVQEKTVASKKSVAFEYVATRNSKYAIVSKHQKGIEVDINGTCTILPTQRFVIMKYDEVSNMWIFVSQITNHKAKSESDPKYIYNTIVFRKGRKIFETTDINYDNLNLHGSVFYRASLCLPADGKLVYVMPFVENMPISKVITESDVGIMTQKSTIDIITNRKRAELYVLNEDNGVFKFVM